MRNEKIDLLRFIGLSMIIFAHVDPPSILFQLRNFDVPLMVLVSGMSFGFGYKNESYVHYLWKRIKRLVFPVWIFLTFYFGAILLLRPSIQLLNLKTLVDSYFFVEGIGYVWIIRVFLLVALVSPPIYFINNKVKSDSKYLLILFTAFLCYESVRFLTISYANVSISQAVLLTVFYIIPYSFVFALGLRLPALNYKKNLLIIAFFSSAFVAIGIELWMRSRGFVQTQDYKYPPSLYYLAYAMSASIFIWVFSGQIWKVVESAKVKGFVLFVAQNSLWIYLWHIPIVKFLEMNFLLKYLVAFTVPVVIMFIQVWFVQNVLMSKVHNKVIQKNLKALFTG